MKFLLLSLVFSVSYGATITYCESTQDCTGNCSTITFQDSTGCTQIGSGGQSYRYKCEDNRINTTQYIGCTDCGNDCSTSVSVIREIDYCYAFLTSSIKYSCADSAITYSILYCVIMLILTLLFQ